MMSDIVEELEDMVECGEDKAQLHRDVCVSILLYLLDGPKDILDVEDRIREKGIYFPGILLDYLHHRHHAIVVMGLLRKCRLSESGHEAAKHFKKEAAEDE